MKRYQHFLAVLLIGLSLMACGGGGGGGSAAPTTVPAAPAAVTANAGSGQVTINWEPVAGADSYNVYQGSTSGITKVTGTRIGSNITASSFTASGLTNGTSYCFLVTAINAAGESGASIVKSAIPSATPPPMAPLNVKGTAGSNKATISWDASGGAASYNIYYSTTSGVTKTSGIKIAGAASPQAVTGLANGTPYFFVVTAVNANGESTESSQVSATATTGGTPITFVLPPSLGSIQQCSYFSYQMGPVTGGAGYPYTISLCSMGGSPPLGIIVNAGGLIAGVPSSPEGNYPFAVCVTDAAFNQKSQSTSITVVPPISPGTPSAPSPANGATGVSTSSTLAWAATPDTDSYNVYFGTTFPPPKVATVTANSYTPPTGLNPNTTYYWQIIAIHNTCNLLPPTVAGGPTWSFTTSSGSSGGQLSLTISSAKCEITSSNCTGCGCTGTLYTMSWTGSVSGPVGSYVVFGGSTSANCGSWQASGNSCSRDLASDPSSTSWSFSVLNNSGSAPGSTYSGEFTVYDLSSNSASASYSMTCPCP